MSPLGIRRPAPERPVNVRTPPALLDVLRDGPAPLALGADPERPSLSVAFVVVGGRRAGGAIRHLAGLVPALRSRGHDASVAVEPGVDADALVAARVPVTPGWRTAEGADVAVAVASDAVPAVLALSGVRARAVLQLDDDAAVNGASAAGVWAGWATEQQLPRLCAGPGLDAADGGAVTASYAPGIDHAVFRPLPTHRRDDLVLAFVPHGAPWRGAPIAVLALQELRRRRPEVELASFGSSRPLDPPVVDRPLGWLEGDALAHAYASATVGLVLSLTAPSVVGAEMLACGLSVVEVRQPLTVAAYGHDGPVELCEPDPLALCAGIERLLDDLALRAERARAGMELAATHTWERAAERVERGVRQALREATGA